MEDFDALCLNVSQEADCLCVHECHALHINNDSVFDGADLRTQLFQVFPLDSSNQTEERVPSICAFLDSEGHRH